MSKTPEKTGLGVNSGGGIIWGDHLFSGAVTFPLETTSIEHLPGVVLLLSRNKALYNTLISDLDYVKTHGLLDEE